MFILNSPFLFFPRREDTEKFLHMAQFAENSREGQSSVAGNIVGEND